LTCLKIIWIEETTLIIPNHNDSLEELSQIASFIADELSLTTPWHLSAFHPDYKLLDQPRTPNETLDLAYKIGKSKSLKYVCTLKKKKSTLDIRHFYVMPRCLT